jgi:hypothetical protein
MELSTTTHAQPGEIGQKDTYRLVIFDPAGTMVLLESQGNEYRLPKIEIPKFTRPAQDVTAFLRKFWSMSSVFLYSGMFGKAPMPAISQFSNRRAESACIPGT